MELIDHGLLTRLGEDLGDEELVVEMLGMFLEELPTRLAEVSRALAAGDYPDIRRAAHGVASPCATLGIVGLCETARVLERSEGASPAEREAMAERIVEVAAATRIAIEGVIAGQ